MGSVETNTHVDLTCAIQCSFEQLINNWSICDFCLKEEYADRIREAGFKMVTYENLMGGIAAIHSGFKL